MLLTSPSPTPLTAAPSPRPAPPERRYRGQKIAQVLMFACCGLLLATLPVTTAAAAPAEETGTVTVTHTTPRTTAISPGEVVVFTVVLSNSGPPSAETTVEINYRPGIFSSIMVETPEEAEVLNEQGQIVWDVGTVAQGENVARLTYRATAAAIFPAGATVAENDATVIVGDLRAETQIASVPLAASLAPADDAQRDNVTALGAWHVILIMTFLIVLAGSVMIMIVWRSSKVLEEQSDETKQWKGIVAHVLSGQAAVVIASAVVLLAIRGTIAEDGAVSVLAGIAGYVLGRTGSD